MGQGAVPLCVSPSALVRGDLLKEETRTLTAKGDTRTSRIKQEVLGDGKAQLQCDPCISREHPTCPDWTRQPSGHRREERLAPEKEEEGQRGPVQTPTLPGTSGVSLGAD